jgi:hypothetical protein
VNLIEKLLGLAGLGSEQSVAKQRISLDSGNTFSLDSGNTIEDARPGRSASPLDDEDGDEELATGPMHFSPSISDCDDDGCDYWNSLQRYLSEPLAHNLFINCLLDPLVIGADNLACADPLVFGAEHQHPATHTGLAVDHSNSIGNNARIDNKSIKLHDDLIDSYDNSDNPGGSAHLEPTPGPDPSLVHVYCEHTFSRDLMQLPAAGPALRHVCEASHSAIAQDNQHLIRQFPNLHISSESEQVQANHLISLQTARLAARPKGASVAASLHMT